MDTINKRIKFYRKKAGYLQSDIAKMLGMKLDTYSKMERKGNINCKTLIRLTDILNVNPLEILYGEETDKLVLPKVDKSIYKPVDLKGIDLIIANNIYEKFAVLAMRNFPLRKREQLYKLILDEFKNLNVQI